MDEQSYIIRIYRSARRHARSRRTPDIIALDGIVEFSAGGEHLVFHNVEEHWAILARNAESGLKPSRLSRGRGKA